MNKNELASGAGICINYAVQIRKMSASISEDMVCKYEMLLKCYHYILTKPSQPAFHIQRNENINLLLLPKQASVTYLVPEDVWNRPPFNHHSKARCLTNTYIQILHNRLKRWRH